jgi:hypothetical protein
MQLTSGKTANSHQTIPRPPSASSTSSKNFIERNKQMLAKKAEQVKEQKLKKEIQQKKRSLSRSGSSFRNELSSANRLPRTTTGPSLSKNSVQQSSSNSFVDQSSGQVPNQSRP